MKTYKEFLLLLEGQQEDLAVKILTQADKLDALDKLKDIDPTKSNKHLPVIAHYYTQGATIEQLKSVFESYFKLGLKPLQYTKKGVKYDGKIVDWIRFSEIVHAAEATNIDLSTVDSENKFDGLTPVWSNDRYKVFLGDERKKCIQLGRGELFCISKTKVSQNMYNSYRFKDLTFYFIFDSQTDNVDEEIIVIYVVETYDGLEYGFTDRRNETVEAGSGGTQAFEEYLERNPDIPQDVFEPVDISEKEKMIKERFSDKKYSDKEFADLSDGEKVLYIENGLELNYEKWEMLNSTQRQLVINTHLGSLDLQIVGAMKSGEKRQYYKRQKQYLDEMIKRGNYVEHEGNYVVELGGRYGVYDSGKEKWFIEPKYDDIYPPNNKGISVVQMGDKWGLLDTNTGEYLVEPKYDRIYEPNAKGIVEVMMDGKVGLLDLNTGKELAEPKYDKIDIPNDKGILIVKLGRKYGLLDTKTGEYLAEPKYDYIYEPDAKGIAEVKIGDKRGLLDWNTGEELAEPKYNFIGGISDKGIAVVILDGKWGLLNVNTGEYLVEPKYDFIYDPDAKGISEVKLGGKYGLLDTKTGEYLVEPKYDAINKPNAKGIAEVSLGDKWGLLDWNTGDELVEPKYDEIYEPNVIISRVKLGRKLGLLDTNTGDELVEPKYDWIYDPNAKGITEVKIGGKRGLLDLNTGKESFDNGKTWKNA